MARQTQEGRRFREELLDELLAGTDPAEVFRDGGLIDVLKKAVAERALDAEMDAHLEREPERSSGNHRNGRSTGSDIHYTSAARSAVADNARASGTDPTTAWVAADSGRALITGLTNGTEYRVRVRKHNRFGPGKWAFATGTPQAQLDTTAPEVRILRPWALNELQLLWQGPVAGRTPAGYQVHYTSAAESAAANDAAAVSGTDPAAGWVDATRTGSHVTRIGERENIFSFPPGHGFKRGTEYRFRVRASYAQYTTGGLRAANGYSHWGHTKFVVGSYTAVGLYELQGAAGYESLGYASVRVRLAAPVTGSVTVDYATAADTGASNQATAGSDYTAVSGTLTFAAGETAKTVSVPVLDDAIDEGREVMRLLLSNPRGAYLRNVHRRARGIITNDDALQQAWLSRFGRTVGGHVTDAVSGRLVDGLTPGAHATVAGQAVDLTRTEDGKALADLLAGLGQRFGAQAPANDEDPFSRSGLGGGADSPASFLSPSTASAASSPVQSMTGRALLLGSAFHVAGGGDGAGPGLAAWGRAAHGRFDGEADSDTGRLGLDGEVLTGTLGADADFGRMLAGVAVSLSEGEGTFDDSGATTGAKGSVESTMTTVSPYARLDLTERVSAWGLGGWGTGAMTLRFDDGTAPVRTDLSMRLGALGARGALLEQDRSGGMDLALRADAFFVTTESEKAAGSAATTADASRLRLVLEGGRSFDAGGGATVRPSLEFGVRHDGGDAETGAGLEVGGGVAFTDPSTGLGLEAKARMLLAHADSDYEEWGASATARLDPGAHGRGLSFSLAPSIGATSSASERLWGAQDARALAPDGGAFEAARGLQGEMGYGMALFGDRFTGTPNLGFGLADGGARDWRLGWRLTSAVRGDPGFEVNLDAIRREAANDNDAEHGVMLRGRMRW